MNYVKVIPSIDLNNPIETAKYYSDLGADEIAYFDNMATKEGREISIETIKQISRTVDIPLIACGGVKRLEDVKKMLYAGAAKVCMKSVPLSNPELLKEAASRFGSDRIIVAIDLAEVKEPVEYAKQLKELGAGEILIDNTNIRGYEEIVDDIKVNVSMPIMLSCDATNGCEIAQIVNKTNIHAISLTSNTKMDIMAIKQAMSEEDIYVNRFSSNMNFSEFKLNNEDMIPVVTQDYKTNEVLMLAYMNKEAFEKTINTGKMTYYSRSRNELWTKGDTSGHYQYLKSLSIDCDNDTLLAKVAQVGAACHTGNRTCFYNELVKKEYNETNPLTVFNDVYATILDRKNNPKEGSYTNYLFDKGIDKILKKVGEEATEIVIAAKNPDSEEMKYEISDFLYHLMVLMADKGLDWKDVIDELAERR